MSAAALDVSTVEQSALAGAAFDFDGDGLSDRAVSRPESAVGTSRGRRLSSWGWPVMCRRPPTTTARATNAAVFRDGAWYIGGQPTVFVGQTGDVPVPGDYDGDGTTDAAVYRDGAWYIDGQATRYFGTASDVPVPGDYDGDGTTDAAVFRPEVGGWYVDGLSPVFYGLSSDVPVPADFDGDGTTDRAVYRPEYGGWYVDGVATKYIGLSSDVPVPADFDGDGIAEQRRLSTRLWRLVRRR